VTDPSTQKPTAFVIMPFGEGFDEIYNLFLVEALSEAGYEVSRADDIRSSQNILKDIVRSIADSHLVVADLTDSNPNVYYELGLAHALGKPVLLLTQDINELPFDLRSYRVLSYKTHFSHVARARKQLLDLAKGVLTGETPFGSPVSDFVGGASQVHARPTFPSEVQGEAGFLDHLVDLEEGFEHLGGTVTSFGEETRSIGESTTEVTQRLQSLLQNPDRGSTRQARALIMALAQRLTDYARSLAAKNEAYAEQLVSVRTALESVVRAQNPRTQEERDQLRKFLDTLNSLEQGARSGLAGITSMAETLRSSPSAERTYNRARDRVVAELQMFAGNIEQTVSVVSRAREIGQTKLSDTTGVG